MKNIVIILSLILILFTGCESDKINDETNHELKKLVFEDKVISMSFKDGTTGDNYTVTGQSLHEFSDIFFGSTFISIESNDDSTGYLYWVTLITDKGKVTFSKSSDISIYGETMSFVSSERYGEIISFLHDYKKDNVE